MSKVKFGMVRLGKEIEIREWTFAAMVIGAWWDYDDMPELYDAAVAMPDVWRL